eukprot:gene11958-biopygen10289
MAGWGPMRRSSRRRARVRGGVAPSVRRKHLRGHRPDAAMDAGVVGGEDGAMDPPDFTRPDQGEVGEQHEPSRSRQIPPSKTSARVLDEQRGCLGSASASAAHAAAAAASSRTQGAAPRQLAWRRGGHFPLSGAIGVGGARHVGWMN